MQAAINDRSITRVEHLTEQFDINARALQRLFDRYVGVSPKWVIHRYRLQEATLSQELGFYDQAHFIKPFKALIDITPNAYAKLTLRSSL